jgi:hypothetical protein
LLVIVAVLYGLAFLFGRKYLQPAGVGAAAPPVSIPAPVGS